MDELVPLDQLEKALVTAKSLDQILGVRDKAEAVRAFLASRKSAMADQNRIARLRILAERKAGQMLASMERKVGRPRKIAPSGAINSAVEKLDVGRQNEHRWQTIGKLTQRQFDGCVEEIVADNQELTTVAVYRFARQLEVEASHAAGMPDLPEGRFETIVVDPPWPIEKIERECRPNQVKKLDYPTMTVEDLVSWSAIHEKIAEDCHVFLWTTQVYLQASFDVVSAWGLSHILTMVWYKPGGFQPVGLPQYNCEFVQYARKGSPKFVDTTDFPCCFEAKRTGHSAKPEEFYETLRRVTAGPRLDMFNRREIDGFEGWGNEAPQ